MVAPPPTPPAAAPDPSPASRPAPIRRRFPLILAAFVVALLAASVGVAATRADPVPYVDNVAAAAGTIGAQPPPTAATTTAPATTTTTERESIPVPDPLPTNPYEDTPQVVLGTIEIPKIGVVADLQEGMTLTAINRGPGHWPGTAAPGHLGNVVVAGHRTTYSKPFADLDLLTAGDQVIFTTPEGRFTYEVRGVIIVPEDRIGIAAQSDAYTATLFACHPKGSATHRIVAKLKLLKPDGTPMDAEADLPPIEQGLDPVTDTTLQVRDTSVPTLPSSGG